MGLSICNRLQILFLVSTWTYSHYSPRTFIISFYLRPPVQPWSVSGLSFSSFIWQSLLTFKFLEHVIISFALCLIVYESPEVITPVYLFLQDKKFRLSMYSQRSKEGMVS